MGLEGELIVRLQWDGTRVERAHVRSTRPIAAARLLRHRSPDEALERLPRMFGVCGVAQSAAATRALENAGAQVRSNIGEVDVLLEIVREYFWRLLIDWPQVARHPVDAAGVAEVRRFLAPSRHDGPTDLRASGTASPEIGAALATLATQRIFGVPPAAWLAQSDLDALAAWTVRGATLPARLLGELMRDAPALGRSDVALMPAATREALLQHVVPGMRDDDAFARAPTWDGRPVETGALARTRSHPMVAALIARDGNTIAARMAARLAELAMLVEGVRADSRDPRAPRWVDGFQSGAEVGVGAVQTARGLLVHRVRIDDARIAEYAIVAPTEWNFHPEGALACGLRGLEADDSDGLERRARLAVQSLDPCVACSIEVGHA